VRYVIIAISSIIATLAIASVGTAQNGQDIQVPSGAKTPAARVFQSHKDLTNDARAKTRASARNAGTNDNPPTDSDHIITPEEHKAIPYRACINARGWKNGRLVCADDGDRVQSQNGREVEGPLSPQ
jgi:hypothetical protein